MPIQWGGGGELYSRVSGYNWQGQLKKDSEESRYFNSYGLLKTSKQKSGRL